MIAIISRLFARSEPVLAEAGPRDSAALAVLHGASFHRGWSEGEFEQLLCNRNVVAHRAAIGRQLLDLHLRRLAWFGTRTVFLEVDANNAPALRLYERAGFRRIGRREGYYPAGRGSAALILRRDLAA